MAPDGDRTRRRGGALGPGPLRGTAAGTSRGRGMRSGREGGQRESLPAARRCRVGEYNEHCLRRTSFAELHHAEPKARGQAGLQVYIMCEIPSNVILAEEFARQFDGFSIGSNDLTQLV